MRRRNLTLQPKAHTNILYCVRQQLQIITFSFFKSEYQDGSGLTIEAGPGALINYTIGSILVRGKGIFPLKGDPLIRTEFALQNG